MKLSFFGGAQSVTGANYLLEFGDVKGVVDCGLNQGSKYAEDLNYQAFKYDSKEIQFVFITHAHIDHVGRLPKLYKDGFRGTVYMTDATADLISVALPDNLNQLTREAQERNHPPLFEQKDLDGVMKLVKGIPYGEDINLAPGVVARLHDAGHVLGSSIIEFENEGKKFFFSGDLGNSPTPLLKNTEFIHGANYIVVESAYGDRIHEARDERRNIFRDIIKKAVARKGTLMIPCFALERTQELLFELNGLHEEGQIPKVPIFIDSPLAIKLTGVYAQHSADFNIQVQDIINGGDDIFNFPGIKITMTPDESKRINNVPGPKIIIAGSGMSQGGRILHHERRYLSDPNSTILFVGYQVDGTLGRRIQDGEKNVTVFHEPIEVRCHVETLSGYSAHADQPTLLHWVKEANTKGSLKKVFVVQGDPNASATLANLIKTNLGIEAIAPKEGEAFELL